MSGSDNISPQLPDNNGAAPEGNPFMQPGSSLTEEKLLAYLNGELSTADQYEVEQHFGDEGMESDAQEGLNAMKPSDVRVSSEQVKRRLKATLHARNKKKKKAGSDLITWVALMLVLLLAVAAYVLIKMVARNI